MHKGKGYQCFLRMIAFLLCAIIVYTGVDSIVGHTLGGALWRSEFQTREFDRIPAHSIDALSLGSSQSANSFDTMALYDQYGISSYNAGVEDQLVVGTYLTLIEFLRRQAPKVVLLDVYMFFRKEGGEPAFRKSFDHMSWSREKYQALEYMSSDYLEDSKLSYFFPILKFHTRYKEIRKTDFVEASREDYYFFFRGFLARTHVYAPEPPMTFLKTGYDDSYEEFDKHAQEYIPKIVELCRENNIELIAYKTPIDPAITSDNRWSEARYNTICKWAEDNDIPYIDFNIEAVAGECNFDYSADQANFYHQNSRGAVKLTNYLGEYLHNNYTLPDRRGDPAYKYLDVELERYKREKDNERFAYAKDLSSYLELVKDSKNDYTVIFSVKDNAVSGLDEALRKKLLALGFQSDLSNDNAYDHSFIGVIQNGEVIYERLSDGNDDPERDSLEYRGVLPNGIKYYVKSAGWNVGNTSSIVIDGEEKSCNDRGLNIAVYDSRQKRVVDTITFDTYLDAGITYRR